MEIDYDGVVESSESVSENATEYAMRVLIGHNAHVPSLAAAAATHILGVALSENMSYGGGCGLTYSVYREGDELHCSLTVRDMEFNSELYEEDEEEEEDFYEDLYSPKCNHSCVPGVGFWARLKWLFSK